MKRVGTWALSLSALILAGAVSASSTHAVRNDTLRSQRGTVDELERQLPIGLTDEEKTRLHEIGANQTATMPPPSPVRGAAEWEPVTGVLVRYSTAFGLPYDVLREFAEEITLYVLCAAGEQTTCWNALAGNGVNMDHVELIDVETNSMWTRDYGPQINFADGEWGISDFSYNRPRPLDDEVNWQLGDLWGCTVYGSDLVFTGGNFMMDGHGNGFSTDLIWTENSGMSHAAVAQEMLDYLGISNFVVVPDILPTGIHHIDCWAKLLGEETILITSVDSDNESYDELEARAAYIATLTNCYGRPYNIVRVYCGDIGGGEVAAYTNSLILNDKVIVPLFGIASDAGALAAYESAMPGYEVLGFYGSWASDDAIHCRGKEIQDRYMLVVDTNPIQDRESNVGDYRVTALIDDRSGTGLVTDSLIVFWRLEGSPAFNAAAMSATAYPDSYYASIPHQADSMNIEYYIFAKDNSSRRETRPMVAPRAWYTFSTGRSLRPCECLVRPDSLDFGTIHLGDYADATFTVTNQGNDTLSGAVSETSDQFDVVSGGGPFSLAAGESLLVTVRFEPTSVGMHQCAIETGDSLCCDVYCTGEGDVMTAVGDMAAPRPLQNYPNPFNPLTTILFDVPGRTGETRSVAVAVYDVRGGCVKTLVRGPLTAGRHSVQWDGRNESGEAMASGVYFVRLTIGGATTTGKMVLLR